MKKTLLLIVSVLFVSGLLKADDSITVSTVKSAVIGGDIMDIEFVSPTLGFALSDDLDYTQNHGVLKTTDGGLTWTRVVSGIFPARPRAFDFVNANFGYITGYSGMVMKTTDGGSNWTALTTGTATNLNDVKFWDANLGYICGSSGLIMKTTDGGANWVTQTVSGTQTRQAIEFMSQNDVLVAGSSTSVARTTDGGTTWNVQTINPISPVVTLYDIQKISSSVVIACASSQVIFRSTDAGASYSIALDNGTSALYAVDFIDSLNGFFVGSNGLNYRTTNGGITFDSVNVNAFTAQVCRAVYMKSALEIFVGAYMGNILRSTNGGTVWNLITTGTHLYGMDFLDANTGMTVGYRGTVLKTTNGAVTWSDIKSINGFEAYDVKMLSGSNVFVGAASGRIYYSSNGGNTFIERNAPLLSSTIKTIWFFNTSEGFAGNEAGNIYRTTDGGLSWTSVFSFGASYNNVEDIYFVNDSVGFACGDVGKFVKTTNRGQTWDSTGIDGPNSKTLWEMKFLNLNTGYIATADGCIYKTVNAGANWTLQNDTTGLYGVDVIDIDVISETRGLAVGEQGKLFKIQNANQWVTDRTILTGWNLADNLWNVKFVNNNTAFATGYYGTIYRFDVTLITGINNYETASDYELNQNYPNPFNPNTTISFSIPKQEFVTLKVYDILGKEIKTLVSNNVQSGKYTVNFDGTNLPSGIYFFSIKAGNFSAVKKMTLIK